MSSTLTTPSPALRSERIRFRRASRPSASRREPLARYRDREGREREVVTRSGARGSLLVLDRDALTLGDRRLLAHLAADEPAANAALVCALYLDELRRRPVSARHMTAADLRTAPFCEEEDLDAGEATGGDPVDRAGASYRLLARDVGMSIPELRWSRLSGDTGCAASRTVSVRDAVGSLESYEPVRTLTRRALAVNAHGEHKLSIAVLRGELTRLALSPIVLNCKLREVTLARIARDGLTLSEIATRCGRVKRDATGKQSGETSWLARRIGLMPEGGKREPTPWVHSDVLALIARRGLGVSPREVEAG